MRALARADCVAAMYPGTITSAPALTGYRSLGGLFHLGSVSTVLSETASVLAVATAVTYDVVSAAKCWLAACSGGALLSAVQRSNQCQPALRLSCSSHCSCKRFE